MSIEKFQPAYDIYQERIERLKGAVPEAFADGKINWDVLKESLGSFIEDEDAEKEHYAFTWPGKRDARRLAGKPSQGTLVPVPGEGVNEGTTENIFIEGDNLEVLKLLQKSYAGKIKMIYIDPPYNTGNDFVYSDNFTQPLDEYLKLTNQIDEGGNPLVSNKKSDGRFHSKWLSMMYPRLKLACNLLKEDGAIFISIGQEELSNLASICNEVFGEENRIGICVRVMKTGGNKGRFFSPNIEYLFIYAKSLEFISEFRDDLPQDLIDKVYTQVETTGPRKNEKYRLMGLYQPGLDERANQRYWIKCPDGSYVIPPGRTMPKNIEDGIKIAPLQGDGVWRWIYDRYKTELTNNNIIFKETETSSLIDENGKQSKWNIYTKIWLNDRLESGRVPVDLIDRFENRHSSQEMKDLGIPFDFAKPVNFISYLIKIAGVKENDLVLDFFAGSGTTGHAVLAINNEAGKDQHKFILVQMAEPTGVDSEAHKEGYTNIADLGKERIRRVIKQIEKEKKSKFGFKVFKLHKSHFNEWQDYKGTDIKELMDLFAKQEDALVVGWKPENLIFEVMLQEGFPLHSKVESMEAIKANKVVQVKSEFCQHAIFICLDEKIDKKTIEQLPLTDKDIFICLDKALTDEQKVALSDKGVIKTI